MDMPDFRTAQEKEISRLQNCVTKLEFSKEFLEKDIDRLRARVAELAKDRERLGDGCALTVEGMVIHNIHEVLHTSEDWECCMMAMDDAGVPRVDDHGAVYSIWGRACWMLRSGDPLYQSDGQAIDAARD